MRRFHENPSSNRKNNFILVIRILNQNKLFYLLEFMLFYKLVTFCNICQIIYYTINGFVNQLNPACINGHKKY